MTDSTQLARVPFEDFTEPRPQFFPLLTGDESWVSARPQWRCTDNKCVIMPPLEGVTAFREEHAARKRVAAGNGASNTGQVEVVDMKMAAPTWQPQDVNNMCGMYKFMPGGDNATSSEPPEPPTSSLALERRHDHVVCHVESSRESCYRACRHAHLCNSYIYHPKLPERLNASTFPNAQYFLCQQDPYTDLSEAHKLRISDWEGKCCLRYDDKWQPFTPPVWYNYVKEDPHVVSGLTIGDDPLPAAAPSPPPELMMPLEGSSDGVMDGMYHQSAGDGESVVPGTTATRGGLRLHLADEMPDFLAAAPRDAIDEEPNSVAAIRHENTVEYMQYGTIWAVARKQCQRRGLDLCSPAAFCKGPRHPPELRNWTRMTSAFVSGSWWRTPSMTMEWIDASLWVPTLRSCNSWLNVIDCKETDGGSPPASGYRKALRVPAMQIACCGPSEEPTSTATPREIEADHLRRAFLARPGNRNFVLRSLDAAAVRKQVTRRGKPAVLRIVVNHATSGLFASFQWVMLAMRFAKAAGLRAFVDHGPCTLCGYAPFTQDYPYHDWTAGPNAWTYAWEPVDNIDDLMARPQESFNASVDVVTLDTHSIWRLFGQHPKYDIQSFQRGDFTGKGLWGPTLGVGGPVRFDAAWWARQRERAWQLVGPPNSTKPIRMAKGFVRYEARMWHRLLSRSGTALAHAFFNSRQRPRLIAAHIRGTDKQCSISGPKISAEQHFALIDAFLDTNAGSLLFVATDAPSIASKMRARYGRRLLMEDAIRSERNALHERGPLDREGYAMGKVAGAMLDSAHLSRADFLLCANSALGESAVWLKPKLADNMYNLQFPLKEQLKPHHHRLFTGGGRTLDLNTYAKEYDPGVCPPN